MDVDEEGAINLSTGSSSTGTGSVTSDPAPHSPLLNGDVSKHALENGGSLHQVCDVRSCSTQPSA